MKYKNISIVLFAAVSFLAFSGCGSSYKLYSGELSKEQIAEIHNSEEVRILAVDGKMGPNGQFFGYCDQFAGLCTIEILPGEHTFTLYFVCSTLSMNYQSDKEVSVKAALQAGHKYIIRAEADASTSVGHFCIWDETESKQLKWDNTYSFGLKQRPISSPTSEYEMQRHMNMGKQLYFPQHH
jgi:hypothetical protein